MKVSELIKELSYYDSDEELPFYYLKNDTLINCQFHDVELYDSEMGVEFTIQETHEFQEDQE